MNDPDIGIEANLRQITTALVSRCAPSPTNPRKHFDEAALAELTASVRQHGVLQPILLRPWPKEYAYAGALPTFEIVAGERRWRAAKAAKVAMINVVVRDLLTCEVLEMQIVENLQRADLHPLEEAEGYARMVREHGYTVEGLAEKIAKSKAYIYARMKLAELPEEGRKAFFDGELTASTALLIARIPTHKLQVQALQEVLLEGQRDHEPMSARDVKHFLANRYQMDLNKAPFARDDRTLVPAAGACIDCPKRTGVQPEIWDDVGSADVCTDTACFANKKAAQQQRTIVEAKARGITVITGDEAKKVGISRTRYAGEYVSLDAIHYADNKGCSFRELLGEGIEKVLIEDPYSDGRLVETIPRSVLTTKLIEAGLIDDGDEDSPSSTKKAKELQQKVAEENAFRQALYLRIETEIERLIPDPLPPAAEALLVPLLRLAVTRLAKLTGDYSIEHLAEVWKSPGKNKTARIENWIASIQERPLRELTVMVAELTMIDVRVAHDYSVDKPPAVMLAAAEVLGIDPHEVRRQTQPESAGKTVKYRHPQMHDMTWTGRGKQPAWVRGWLEQGKALDDLLAEKASMSV